MIRVAAVDDDRMLLGGLRSWVGGLPDLWMVATASTVDDLLAGTHATADVVLLELLLRDGSDPADNVGRLVAAGHRVLLLSVSFSRDQVVATLVAGASGHLTKDRDLTALAAAIREVTRGRLVVPAELGAARAGECGPARPRLSDREREVLLAYASGMPLKAVARQLGIRPDTARTYLGRVKAKYHHLGRPTNTKLELAERVREDRLDAAVPQRGDSRLAAMTPKSRHDLPSH